MGNSTQKSKKLTAKKLQIQKEFIALLRQSKFDDISISDLTKQANINRGTFYLHYNDKNALLEDLVHHLQETIFNLLPDTKAVEKVEEALIVVFNQLKLQFHLIEALYINEREYLSRLIQDFLMKLVERFPQNVSQNNVMNTLPDDYQLQIFIYSNMGIFMHWIAKGGIESPEEMATLFTQINQAHLIQPSELK